MAIISKSYRFRPSWVRFLTAPFSYTFGNAIYTGRIANFISKIFPSFLPSSKAVWNNLFKTKNNEESKLNYTCKMRSGLETFIFEPKNQEVNSQYYTIHSAGTSGRCARHFEELEKIAENSNRTIITYSPPGVGESEGYVIDQDDLINAMFQQAKFLIDKGVEPNKITLSGMSMGAAVAALTVEKINVYYEEEYKITNPSSVSAHNTSQGVYYFGDRTFSDITDEMIDQIPLLNIIYKIPLLNYIPWLIIKPIVVIFNWDMQPQKAYDKIDKSKKAVVHIQPEAKGEKGTADRDIAKLLGLYRTPQDAKIRAHVALQTSKTERDILKGKILSLQRMLEEKEYKQSKELVETIIKTNQFTNIFFYNKFLILQNQLNVNIPNTDSMSTCVKEMLAALKMERLEIKSTEATMIKDAHTATFEKINIRPSKHHASQKSFLDYVVEFNELTTLRR